MTLPHLARNAVRYDSTAHTVHAYAWDGARIQLQTPAELVQAVTTTHCYAASAVVSAGVALFHAHGVDPQTLPLALMPPLVASFCSIPATQFPAVLDTCLHRLDRSIERTARLALGLLTNDDTVALYDYDGLFAQVLQRMLSRSSDAPRVHITHLTSAQTPCDFATIALVVSTVDEAGLASTQPALGDIPRYVVACSGPSTTPHRTATTTYHAVVTARGIYRPDRITQYYRDPDMGSDIISLG